jgi:hypothetical protein
MIFNPPSAIRHPQFTVTLAISFIGFVAVPVAAQNAAPPEPSPDYFPLDRGSEWVYTTNLRSGELVFSVLTTETIIDTPHTVLALTLLKTEDGRTKEVPLQKEWYRKTPEGGVVCAKRVVNEQEVQVDPPQPHLKGPLAPGASWKWEGRLEHGAASAVYTVEAEEEIQVPRGTFKAFRVKVVTTTENGRGTVTRWLAPGVGMVKEEAEVALGSGGPARVTAELKSYRIGPPKAD